jgi:S1-C subfamily serine protease
LFGSPVAGAADWIDHTLGTFYPVSQVDDRGLQRAAAAVVSFPGATGFLISTDGHILTNHHVFETFGTAGTVRVGRTGHKAGRAIKITLVSKNKKHDVALYRTRTGGLPFLRVRTSAPTVGEPVAVLGHPNGKAMRISFGSVLAKDLVIGGRPSVEYSAQTWWGSSGSPVIDRNGRVFAIHWGWDADGKSNGRLTGVPFNLVKRALPAFAAATRPTPDACQLASSWQITTELVEQDTSTNAGGRSLDTVEVKVAARNPKCLGRVREVTYTLHPSFKNPTISGKSDQTGFPVRLGAWGYFKTRAEITVANLDSPVRVSGMVKWQ